MIVFSKVEAKKYLINNPFTSRTYINLWISIFKQKIQPLKFNSFNPVLFVKSKIPYVYKNVGGNLVNGIYYRTNPEEKDYRKKVFFIRDVPSYFGISKSYDNNGSLKLRSIPQYKGLLADMRSFENVNSYLNSIVSARRLRYYRKCQKRLENSFNITYHFYQEDTDRKKHTQIINSYHKLMNKRYQEKGEQLLDGNILSKKFFKELSFNLLKEKKKGIYCNL